MRSSSSANTSLALAGHLALERVERRRQLGDARRRRARRGGRSRGRRTAGRAPRCSGWSLKSSAGRGGRSRRAEQAVAEHVAQARSVERPGASPAPRRASSARARSARPWATRRTYDTASSSSCSSRAPGSRSSSRLSVAGVVAHAAPPDTGGSTATSSAAPTGVVSSAGVAVDPDPARRQHVGERRAVPLARPRRARRRPWPRAARRGRCRRPPGPPRTCARSPRGERTDAARPRAPPERRSGRAGSLRPSWEPRSASGRRPTAS